MNARDDPNPKIGAGHAAGMFRQGLRELRGALYPESNVAQPTDYGIVGVATPGEVAEARREDGHTMDEERGSVLDERLQLAGVSREAHGREERNQTLDRE